MKRRTPLLAALAALLALAVPARLRAAATLTRGELYSPSSPAWNDAVARTIHTVSISEISPDLLPLAAGDYSPTVAQLENVFGLKSEAFNALLVSNPAEARETLELAVHGAREDLAQKIYALDYDVRTIAASDKHLDAEGRVRLYWLVAQLEEMRRYESYLDHAEQETLVRDHRAAADRAWKVARQMSGALSEEKGEETAPAVVVQLAPPANSAVKILERMRANKIGWRMDDYQKVFLGFGFERREGGNHTVYTHPRFHKLTMAVPRHNGDLDPANARQAVGIIDELLALASAPGTPVSTASPFKLSDLTILLGASAHPFELAASAQPLDPASAPPERSAPRLSRSETRRVAAAAEVPAPAALH